MILLQKVAQLLGHVMKRKGPLHLALLLLAPFALSILFGVAFYYAERRVAGDLTLQDSIWWAMVTMTTVGYGDFYPSTFVGRFLVGFPAFLIGIGVLGYFIGYIADRIVSYTTRRRKGLSKILHMKDHVIICDCPDAAKVSQIARELRAVPAYESTGIILIDARLDELPETLNEHEIEFVRGEPTARETLLRAQIEECQGVIILSSRADAHDADARAFAISAIVSQLAEELGKPIRIASELKSRQNTGLMRLAKDAGIMSHEGITDCLLVQEFLNPGINKIFHQIITNARGCQLFIHKTKLRGVPFVEAQIDTLKANRNLQLIGLIHNGECSFNPGTEAKIQPNDRLVLLAASPEPFTTIEEKLAERLPA